MLHVGRADCNFLTEAYTKGKKSTLIQYTIKKRKQKNTDLSALFSPASPLQTISISHCQF